jgi:hypothetical protein
LRSVQTVESSPVEVVAALQAVQELPFQTESRSQQADVLVHASQLYPVQKVPAGQVHFFVVPPADVAPVGQATQPTSLRYLFAEQAAGVVQMVYPTDGVDFPVGQGSQVSVIVLKTKFNLQFGVKHF